jgi:hypothetical protein
MSDQNKENLIEIRASGLPGAMDCWRKWAMQMAADPRSKFAPIMQKHGFDIPIKRNGIGAAIGSACHEAFGQYWQAKIDGYDTVNLEQVAIGKFRKLNDEGIEYDKLITKDPSTAEAQIKRILTEYAPFAVTLKPKRVEFRLETRIDILKPYLVTGTPDLYTESEAIRDEKFGRHLSPYEAQAGAYSLIARSHGMPVSGLFIDWVPRTSINQLQKPLTVIEYDIKVAEDSAHYMIEEAVQRLDKFIETGNEWSFTANPNSKLCSKTWCPAWGTRFCNLGRPENKENE